MAVNLQTDNNLSATEQYIKDTSGNASNLAIGTDGKVGIGTDAPSDTLTIAQSGDGTIARIARGGVTAVHLGTQSPGTFKDAFVAAEGSLNTSRLKLGTGGGGTLNLLLTITSEGTVGIGTDAPNLPLDIESPTAGIDINNTDATDGDPFVRFQKSGTTKFVMGIDDSDSDKFKMAPTFLDSNTRLTIDGSGNIGIGTSNPGSTGSGGSPLFLHVHRSGTSGTNGGILALSSDNTQDGTVGGLIDFATFGTSGSDKRLATIAAVNEGSSGTSTNGALAFGTWNAGSYAENMRITKAGQVGIGTISPDAKLDVEVGTNTNAIIATRTDANPVRLKLGFNGTSGYPSAQADRDGFGVQPLLLNPAGGNVGIGLTSPGTKLAIAGLSGSSSGNLLRYDTSSGNIYYDSSSCRFKENIRPLNTNFLKLLDVQPVSYTDKATGSSGIGYTAEEFDALGLSGLVSYDKEGYPEGIHYEKICVYLIEIVKTLTKSVRGKSV